MTPVVPFLALAFGAWSGPDAATAAPVTAAPLHAIAYVNDWRSHGVLGDDYLSLNEFILLHNRQLTFFQLSINEQNQISGFGQDVQWCALDATSTPVVTVERDLEPVQDLSHGAMFVSFNGSAVIDFTTSTGQHGFRAVGNYLCNWENLILQGGPYGIDLVQTSIPGAFTQGSLVRNVEFVGQTQFGMRVTMGADDGVLRVILQNCKFTSPATCFVVDEQAARCTSTLVVLDTAMSGAGNGIDIALGPGGSGLYEFDHLAVDVGGDGLQLRRNAAADRAATVVSRISQLRGARALAITGSPAGRTTLQLAMVELRAATPTGKALAVGPAGSRILGTIDELTAVGDVDLLAGAGTLPTGTSLLVNNARLRNGAVVLGTSPSQILRLLECRFDGCAVQTQGGNAIAFDDCCLVGGSLTGTATATAQCNGCFLQAAVGAFVSQTAAKPGPQLGSFAVLPATITIGGQLVYQADLPPGLVGVFVLGLAVDPLQLSLLAYPLHVYSDPAATATIPGIYRLQQSFQFAVPNSILLVGTAFTAHMAVLPDPGVQAPWINFPPGRRFVVQ